MNDGRPAATELLDAALGWLEGELLPGLEGAQRYRARIAANMLHIVRRELALGAAHARAERDDLAALAGEPATGDPTALSEALADRIDAGRLAPDDPALLAWLERSLRRTLAVDHPGWCDGD